MSEAEEYTAAAPPDPEAPGTGETAFSDAEAPPASDAQPTSSAGTGGAAAEAEAAAPEAAEAQRYLALAQRTQADFENFRKRMARENAQAVDRGIGKLAKELLPALDHFDLALKAAEGEHPEVVRGFALVRDELVNALGKVGIQPFSPDGEAFDPTEHEAMASQPVEDAESGTVVEVYTQGYRINGAVLRPARVVVAQ